MRILADAMLGSLARWLRIMGYDTLYDPGLGDHELVRIARAEGRILLTRDRELTRRRNVAVLFVHGQRLEEQLQQVLGELPLPAPAPYSRCPVCNDCVEAMLRSEAWGLVPPYVFVTHDQFQLCPTCNRIYWRGTHWQHMQQTLRSLCR